MQGYLHPFYAQSFSEIGEVIFLPKSKGWLIKRQIPGTTLFDAMGPYPLFFCENWEYLIEDIFSLRDQIVSIILVIGPHQELPKIKFKNFFDLFYEYKNHYIFDKSKPLAQTISSGRRYDAMRALKDVNVDLKISPNIDLEEWCHLYSNLIERYQITGIRAFSEKSFKNQLTIPNTYFFRVLFNGELIGGNIFYIQNHTAYWHLSACTEKGYQLHASYAAIWTAIKVFSKKIHRIDFGGTTNMKDNKFNGLAQFKSGWSNSTECSYFCGKILNLQKYRQLIKEHDENKKWFPAYRSPDEF